MGPLALLLFLFLGCSANTPFASKTAASETSSNRSAQSITDQFGISENQRPQNPTQPETSTQEEPEESVNTSLPEDDEEIRPNRIIAPVPERQPEEPKINAEFASDRITTGESLSLPAMKNGDIFPLVFLSTEFDARPRNFFLRFENGIFEIVGQTDTEEEEVLTFDSRSALTPNRPSSASPRWIIPQADTSGKLFSLELSANWDREKFPAATLSGALIDRTRKDSVPFLAIKPGTSNWSNSLVSIQNEPFIPTEALLKSSNWNIRFFDESFTDYTEASPGTLRFIKEDASKLKAVFEFKVNGVPQIFEFSVPGDNQSMTNRIQWIDESGNEVIASKTRTESSIILVGKVQFQTFPAMGFIAYPEKRTGAPEPVVN